jgi:hypothetical protein
MNGSLLMSLVDQVRTDVFLFLDEQPPVPDHESALICHSLSPPPGESFLWYLCESRAAWFACRIWSTKFTPCGPAVSSVWAAGVSQQSTTGGPLFSRSPRWLSRSTSSLWFAVYSEGLLGLTIFVEHLWEASELVRGDVICTSWLRSLHFEEPVNRGLRLPTFGLRVPVESPVG